MKKLLVLGTVPTNVEMVRMAKKRGIYTIVTDYMDPENSPAKLIADEYWMISTNELDVLEQKCREEGITAIVTGITENNAVFMAELCQRLDLPCWCTPKSWNSIQVKDQFKRLCRENGVLVAKDYFLSDPPTEEELNEIRFPVVVKPVDLNSTKGVRFCDTKEAVVNACAYARSLSKVDTLIVEQKLTGDFVIAQCALAEGEAVLLTVTSSVMADEAEYTYVTISTEQLKRMYEAQVMPALRKLLKQAGCREGICTVQGFLGADNNFYAIEMGYRNSGDQMLYAIRQAFGFDMIKWLLDVALGEQHTPEDLPVFDNPEGRHACKYTIFSKAAGTVTRMEGLEAYRNMPGIMTWLDVSFGQRVAKGRPLVRATFAADSEEHIRQIIETINETVRIYDENGENIMLYFDNFEGIHKAVNR